MPRLLLVSKAGGEALPLRGNGDSPVQSVALDLLERGALLRPRSVGAGTYLRTGRQRPTARRQQRQGGHGGGEAAHS
jgi:hypothetical protein